MDESVLIGLGVIVFAALLFDGRRTLAAGSNPRVANGALLLVLATLVGVAVIVAIA